MNSDLKKTIELYEMKAEKFARAKACNQEKYYKEVAEWLAASGIETLEEAIGKMKETPYYEGASTAKNLDDIEFRIWAMNEVGYEEAAEIHRTRRQKLIARGNEYVFSQEWISDMELAHEKVIMYAKRKEAFGKVFEGYLQLKGNPQKIHRKAALKSINEGLEEIEKLGVSFYELAEDRVYRNLIMVTEKGLNNFVEFIKTFNAGENLRDSIDENTKKEQQQVAGWVNANRQEIIKAGKEETWKNAACVAVPSDDPMGYDFVALKEV